MTNLIRILYIKADKLLRNILFNYSSVMIVFTYIIAGDVSSILYIGYVSGYYMGKDSDVVMSILN